MISIVLDGFANTVALVLFCQSLWTVGWLAIGKGRLVPPDVPNDQLEDVITQASKSQKTLSTDRVLSEAQLAIAKAVHPHLHDSEQRSESARTQTAQSGNLIDGDMAGSNCSRKCLDVLSNSKLYQIIVPYCSIALALVQALLGTLVTVAILSWQLSGAGNCDTLGQLTLVCLFVGFMLLLLASAVQTHITNSMCIKIFFIMAVGFSAHFVMLGLIMAHKLADTRPDAQLQVCQIDLLQPHGWLHNLPLYTSIAHFFMCFFSLISFINAAFRLCTHSRFLVPREIITVFAVYRGLGLLFAGVLFGVVISAVIAFVAAFSHFRLSLCWMLQWAIMSRIMAAALWHRVYTDTKAPSHAFWTSSTYFAMCNLNAMPPQDPPHADSNTQNIYKWSHDEPARPGLWRILREIAKLSSSEHIHTNMSGSSSLESLLAQSSHDRDSQAVIGPQLRNMSRHETIVENSPCLSSSYLDDFIPVSRNRTN
ncbi:hypothetical protein LPJ78_000242 [Coemansia sp. RSA 989]|nr:hypothetical protein BX667DRAFT_502304 [Coemansia mojavensis]KAJ1743573.1 hypothetical protein LPJ68_000838 [Coemansia sp. RSA 1086]KAJ1752730.1 hypothetical protein LPJ79_000986 [Coemansia sp. RSA 1821]KAJ1868304.1 hypothetical protein LPJ78_000242 [Coemansia sp. RSA 989]KAJ1875584.1 hypothetical protein LPJ55_000577 [Coemansia sp. RSA 990]